VNFKIKSLDHFLLSFLSKNGNFKTLDFSPLIKRVLARVSAVCNVATRVRTLKFLAVESREMPFFMRTCL
jgi:hypothetical protein